MLQSFIHAINSGFPLESLLLLVLVLVP